jgi:hypothetical protein
VVRGCVSRGSGVGIVSWVLFHFGAGMGWNRIVSYGI